MKVEHQPEHEHKHKHEPEHYLLYTIIVPPEENSS
jgi:hypothetical protein